MLTLQSLHSIKRHTDRQDRAEQAVVAAIGVEKLTLDLETGTRGYAITADKRFLQPWHAAQAELPAQMQALRRVAPRPFADRVGQRLRAYLNDFSIPLVRLVPRSPAAARAQVATGAGKKRIDAIRGLIDPFVQHENEA